jgi:hypothetical protein
MDTPLNILRKQGLLGKRGPDASKISSLNLANIVDISKEVDEAVRCGYNPAEQSIFRHAASLNLGGSSIECCWIGCRLRRIRSLARFALMYSDDVYIDCFLSGYKDISSNSELEAAKKGLYDDLVVLHEIEYPLETGYIKLFAPMTDVCFTCQAKEFLGEDAGKRFKIAYNKLKRECLDNMHVKCSKEDDEYFFDCNGPLPYFQHKMIVSDEKAPKALLDRPRIMRQIETGKAVTASKTLIRQLELNRERARIVATNAIHGIACSGRLGTTFLTEDDIHVFFLNSLHKGSMARDKNLVAARYLTSFVPFVEDVALRDIIKIRNRETEAFISYRQALNHAIGDFTKAKGEFTVKDAQALYADVINPSLVVLDKKVKQSKRDLISKPMRSLAGVVGTISFGLLTGLISKNLSSAAMALGLLKFGTDFVGDVMATGDKEKAIENDQYYFLWKVKKASKLKQR